MNEVIRKFFISNKVTDSNCLIDSLVSTTCAEICAFVAALPQKTIVPANIPQYSNYLNGTVNLIAYLRKAGNYGPTFTEVGIHLLGPGRNTIAYTKYGENHSKLAGLLSIVTITSSPRRKVLLNDLGIALEKRSEAIQIDCLEKLAAGIPIVQYAIKHDISNVNQLDVVLEQYLSHATVARRRQNAWKLIAGLIGENNAF